MSTSPGCFRRRFLLGLYPLELERLARSDGFLLGFPIGGIPGIPRLFPSGRFGGIIVLGIPY